jgi:triosephosphate isomerase (TIM)
MTPDTQVGAGAPRGTGGGRRPLIAGNWKLWGTRAQATEYCERLPGLLPDDPPADVAICPPFTALEVCVERLDGSGVAVAAQTMHHEESGAFTGEVSATMLTELGVAGVVLGHSERRQYNCETDRALQQKVPAALSAGLQPILCVGESEEERERDETQRKLRTQVQEALEKVSDERLADVVIAYEPIWAIGTGKVATPEIAQEAIGFIRALVGDRSEEAAQRVRILYGGSVKPDNAPEILAQPDVDGALVGGASLDPKGLAQIVAAGGP